MEQRGGAGGGGPPKEGAGTAGLSRWYGDGSMGWGGGRVGMSSRILLTFLQIVDCQGECYSEGVLGMGNCLCFHVLNIFNFGDAFPFFFAGPELVHSVCFIPM